MSAGKVLRVKFITRQMVESAPNTIFVFGDNMLRFGMGGQARAMRGCSNAIGVPTKWAPGMLEKDFFADSDLENVQVICRLAASFAEISALLMSGYDVVFPTDGLGTGLSELPRRAPRMLLFIEGMVRHLEDAAELGVSPSFSAPTAAA